MLLLKSLLYAITAVLSLVLLCGCLPGNHPTTSPNPMTKMVGTFSVTTEPTIVPTNSFTPIPTMLSDEAHTLVREYLKNGSDCRLPCWLGITPGVTKLLDLHEKLIMLSSIATEAYDGLSANGMSLGRLEISYQYDNMVIELSTNYISFPGKDIISVVTIYNRAYRLENNQYSGDVYGYPIYNDFLEPYK
jgi:hypothetical protein